MIENIKKEIQIIEDGDELVTLTKVYEILNKYKDQDANNSENATNQKIRHECAYKNAWEELKKFNINDDWYINQTQVETIKELIKELEKKHNIGDKQ